MFAPRPGAPRRGRGSLAARIRGAFDAGVDRRLAARGLRFLPLRSGFPPLLRAIHDPPPGLFLRGAAATSCSRAAVAIVGARACSAYGAHVARSLGRELAAAGLVVVSGLARGIDGEAHRGALEAGGTTVAVLGCGIDRDYPAAHARARAARSRERGSSSRSTSRASSRRRGAFRRATGSSPGSAPRTVVVEARERSGALITADLALEEGREVLAVPGEITSRSRRDERAAEARRARRARRRRTCSRRFGVGTSGGSLPSLERGGRSVLDVLADAAASRRGRARDWARRPARGVALAELELAGLSARPTASIPGGEPAGVASPRVHS